jgi:hypothetical protein
MAEEPLPKPPNSRQLMEDLSKFFQHAYAWLQEKINRIYALLRERDTRHMPDKKVSSILSHWHKLFEGFQESPQRIYGLMEEAIKRRKIPDVKISRISYPEAGALSARREYLRVRRKEHIFDICAAPFGTGFFVSWWLGEPKTFFWLLASIIFVFILIIGLGIGLPWWLPLGIGFTIIGLWKLSLRPTYYRLDTALMFQDSVHSAVLEVIEQATEGKGLKALSEPEKKPIMSDLFKRMVK